MNGLSSTSTPLYLRPTRVIAQPCGTKMTLYEVNDDPAPSPLKAPGKTTSEPFHLKYESPPVPLKREALPVHLENTSPPPFHLDHLSEMPELTLPRTIKHELEIIASHSQEVPFNNQEDRVMVPVMCPSFDDKGNFLFFQQRKVNGFVEDGSGELL